MAGNKDRVGAAGATELLVNPWARSTALGDANVAAVNGIESTFINIAGLSTVEKTQIKVDYTNWLGAAKVNLVTAGVAQRLGDAGVISVGIQSFNFGDVMRTTVENPEGGIGTFSPRLNVFSIGYAKMFTPSIHGGIQFKVINEGIADAKATGVAIDAGVRYQTGKNDRLKIGITLKNVGPSMKYKGDGFQSQASILETGADASLEQISQGFELPSILSLGFSYDVFLNAKAKEGSKATLAKGELAHVLTPMAAFTANSFGKDQIRVGLDYGLVSPHVAFNLRFGYVYENGVFKPESRTTALTGLTAGFSIDALTKNKSAIGIEYAVRMANLSGGSMLIHSVGIAVSLK